MPTPPKSRDCARCRSRLATDNADQLCAACRRKAADDLVKPPQVPRSFWHDDQMREALDSWHFGRIFSAYRLHPFHGRALSQELVAGWLNITQAQLSRIEGGRAPEELSKLTHWATTLGIPSDLLWFKVREERRHAEGAVPHQTSAVQVRPLHRKGDPPLALAAAGLMSSLTGHLPGANAEEPMRPIGAFDGLSLAESASQVLTLFLQLDAQLGGDVLYAPLSQYVARMALAVEADPSDGLLAFGQLSQMAGWLAVDGNRHGAARRYLTTAAYVGHEADDPGLAASATAYMSLHAMYRGQLEPALALARTARATDESALTPLTRTMLATREARAHAGLGHERNSLHALDEMRTAFEQNGEAEEPLWLSYVDAVEVAAQEGACYLGLGRAKEAETVLAGALTLLDEQAPHRVRDRVHYLSRLAKAHLLRPDVEQACFVATEALELSAAIGSARVAERLGEFREALAPFAGTRAGREFEERMRSMG
ncbi:transcriptional regulator with XRE-family HTH domain/tetratricopeptide (TPR) repeat protein [Catenulispora sp. GAS73]|uniref:DNA-binding protein n=1 Tax=Catenulispora sp. GAS73 TaxID=3156269 RepID=UPI00351787CC